MTLATTDTRFESVGNGVTVAFTYPRPFINAADIKVVLVTTATGAETAQVLNTHYTVSGSGLSNGVYASGTVTFVTPPTSTQTVVRYRDPALTQEVAVADLGTLPLETIERTFDEISMKMQALDDLAVKRSAGSLSTFDTTIPNPKGKGGYALGFKTDETGLQEILLDSVTTMTADAVSYYATRAAAVAATIPSVITTVILAGYTTAGDGGRAHYRRSASAPSHAAHFQSADGAYWILDESIVDIRMLGAVASLATNSRTAIQNAIGYVEAVGGEVYIPIGQFRIDSGLSITKPIRVFGSGSGGGPGAVTNANCSQIVANFLSGDVISVVTDYAVTFEHFQITSNVGARSTGAGIHISGDAANNANSVINDVAFNQQYIDIHHTDCNENLVTQTYHQAWVRSAYLNSSNGTEVGAGDINCSYFFGETTSGATQTACVECHSGYTRVTSSLLLGAQRGILWDIDEIAAGALMARGNHIEEQALVGIDVLNNALDVASGEKQAAMLQFQGNEFSNVANVANFVAHIRIAAGDANWIKLIQIQGNTYKSQLAAGDYFILINTGETVEISGETMDNAGAGTPTGITIGAQATKVQVQDNILTGTYGTKYSLTTECAFRDYGSRLVLADLPTCAEGSEAYATDVRPGSLPAVGSGTGTAVLRRNSQWESEAAVGGFTPLATTTASSNATRSFVLSTYGTGFKAYMVLLEGVIPATDAVNFRLKFSTDGGSSYIASAYQFAHRANYTGGGFDEGSTSRSDIPLSYIGGGGGVSNSSTHGVNGRVMIFEPSSTTRWTQAHYDISYHDENASERIFRISGSGAQAAAQDTDAIQFDFSSGNIASGTFKLYGIR